LSIIGMILLAGGRTDGANRGALLILLCAAALGLPIALLSRLATGYNAPGLAGDMLLPVQIFGAALILSALAVGEVAPVIIMSPKKQTYKKGDVL
jgi:hypothetical protein